MDVNYILLLITAVIMALAYGLIGYFADKLNNAGAWNWAKFYATIVYSIIVGVIAVNTGVITLQNISDYSTIFSPVWVMYGGVYLGLIYVFSKIVVPVVSQFTSKTTFFPRTAKVDPSRKMDPESRQFLVFDLPQQNQSPTLSCVDQAEATIPVTMRYAIQSGAWIFLVEFGELTGSKHYWFRGWFGTSEITWKPITSECLETVRRTGKFPEYEELY